MAYVEPNSLLLDPVLDPAAQPVRALRARLSRAQFAVLFLLAISVFINVMDRGNLSIAAPMLKDEFGISAYRLGLLLSSFFATYAAFQIVAGWLVDRFDVNWVMAGGFALWSLATAATGLVHVFAALLILRLVLGIGESVAYPSYCKIFATHFPEHHRGFANAFIAGGFAGGPALGVLIGGMAMARWGWRPFFIALGLVSLFWLIPWIQWMPRGAGIEAPQAKGDAPGMRQILVQRSAWGTFAGLFCSNYTAYFLITWLPFYLVRERHFSMQTMAKVGGAAFLSIAVSAVVSGWLSDRFIAAGRTPTVVRKSFVAVGLTLAASIVAVPAITGSRGAIAVLCLACVAFGMAMPNVWSISQTLAGPSAVGKWTGLMNCIGNLAGVVAPAITGLVVDRTGQFFFAFAITAGLAVVGAMVWVLVVGRVEPVEWRPRGLAV